VNPVPGESRRFVSQANPRGELSSVVRSLFRGKKFSRSLEALAVVSGVSCGFCGGGEEREPSDNRGIRGKSVGS